MRSSAMAGSSSLGPLEGRMFTQPVMHLLAVHPLGITQQGGNLPAQRRATQARTRPLTRTHVRAKIRLSSTQPRPLARCTTGIASDPNDAWVAGREHRPTLRRAGCTQHHTCGQSLGTGLVQYLSLIHI